MIFGKLFGAISKIGTGIGTLRRGFALLKSISGIGGVITSFGGLLATNGPFIPAIVAVGAAIGGIILIFKHWGAITKWLKGVWKGFSTWIGGLWNHVKPGTSKTWNGIKNGIGSASKRAAKNAHANWEGLKKTTSQAWSHIKTSTNNAWHTVTSTISNLTQKAHNSASGAWDKIKTSTGNAWENVKGTISNKLGEAGSNARTNFDKIRSVTSEAWGQVKSVTGTLWSAAKSIIGTHVGNMKSVTSSGFNAIRNITRDVWGGVKEAMTNPVQAAKDTISNIISDVRGFFSTLHLSFPRIEMPPLPHFVVHGGFDLNPKHFSLPSVSVDWYAKGGIFTQPTIFGGDNVGLKGAGEAGPETALLLNEETLGAIGRGIAASMGTQSAALQIDGQTFGRIVGPYVDQYLQAHAADLGFGRGYQS